MTIFKYPLPVVDLAEIQMPVGARVLTVQVQNGSPCLWALVDSAASLEVRQFRILGTGHPADDITDLPYVGTFQLHGGSLVFHVFDRRTA